MASYLPETESALRDWADNFAALITANPGTYGLMASDAAAVSGYVDVFAAALTVAIDPATRTIATVVAKDSAKAAMVATLRQYAQLIKLNKGVTNACAFDEPHLQFESRWRQDGFRLTNGGIDGDDGDSDQEA